MSIARKADKHDLYQRSVQDPDHDLDIVERVFRKEAGRKALALREDFCGTAYTSATWVSRGKDRTATGVDLDRSVLAWGKKHNIAPLGDAASRVTLLRQDVRAPVKGPFDVTLAFNFSYFIFGTREELVGYFRNVRRSLARDGIFFLDMYGGPEAQEEGEETRRVSGFTYIWDQSYVNPIDMTVVNYIHFRFRDGSQKKRAFKYVWRLWSCPELRELLEEAGFSWVDFYFEDEDEDGDPTGTWRRRTVVPADPAWLAYVVAGNGPKKTKKGRRKRGRR